VLNIFVAKLNAFEQNSIFEVYINPKNKFDHWQHNKSLFLSFKFTPGFKNRQQLSIRNRYMLFKKLSNENLLYFIFDGAFLSFKFRHLF